MVEGKDWGSRENGGNHRPLEKAWAEEMPGFPQLLAWLVGIVLCQEIQVEENVNEGSK